MDSGLTSQWLHTLSKKKTLRHAACDLDFTSNLFFQFFSCILEFVCVCVWTSNFVQFNLLTPNVNYSGRTAPLTSKVAFYIFIQQIQVREYFKHGIYFPFFLS